MKKRSLLSMLFLVTLSGCGSTTVKPNEHQTIYEDLKNCTNVSIKQTLTRYNEKGEYASEYYEIKIDKNKLYTHVYADEVWPENVIHNLITDHESVLVFDEDALEESKNVDAILNYVDCDIYSKKTKDDNWSHENGKQNANNLNVQSYISFVAIDFEALAYDEENKAYTYEINGDHISLQYKNNKLVKYNVTNKFDDRIVSSYTWELYDYGSTSIKIPKI